MKKYFHVLFASVLFAFNGNAQCTVPLTQIVEYDFLADFPIGGDTVYCYNDILTEIKSNIQGGSGAYSYKWYFTTDINLLYNDVRNSPATWTLINGATNSNYTPPPITQSIRYKCVTTDVNCPALIRNDFTFVYHLYKVNQIEAVQKTCSPASAASTVDKTNDPLWKNTAAWYTIQWQSSTSETGTYIPISGATNFLYNPVVQSNVVYYRRSYSLGSHYFSGTCATQVTNAVAINPITCLTFSSSITGPASVTPNQTAIYSVPAQAGMQYLWAVTNGTITSGQGTYIITIMWDGGASANAGTSVAVTETNDIQASKTTTQVISMTTTDINKGLGSTGISVFPNPAKNQFTIEMPTANTAVNYTLYSTSGIQMQAGAFNASASGNTITTQVPAGMYQLVLNYDGMLTSTRLAVIE